MSTAIETIRKLHQQAESDYDGIVKTIAAGETPKLRQFNEALAATGRTREELGMDAQRLIDRRIAAEQLREADAMTAEIQATEAEFKDATGKHQELYNRQLEELRVSADGVGKLHKRYDALLVRQRELRASAQKTLRTTADAAIESKLAQLAKTRTELLHLLQVVYPHRSPATVTAEIEAARVKFKAVSDKNAIHEANAIRERITRLKAELKKSEEWAEICKPYQVKLADVEAEMAGLEAAKMQP